MDENEFKADLITLVDEEGKEHEFEILDIIENDDGCFYALLPSFLNAEEELDSDATYYIFESIENNGEFELAEVENEELLDKLAQEFEDRFSDLYEDFSEQDDEEYN